MKQRNTRSNMLALALTAASISMMAAANVNAQTSRPSPATPVVERGKFRFYDTKQPQGEESYEITNAGNNITIRSQLNLESETRISLTSSLVLRLDLTPERFEINGKKPSSLAIDSSVDIREKDAHVREGKG